ncbi:uncharacterized protein F4807DRAFT_373725 [Annulohypoxylon truncatum]|uniref:uncharacterized protein n=1 Tax=Annulohypoxylon truncatum TaxID=327061 RepID=UPI002008160C|nr:uncharacterized protein F4807DRAFT_373725 [Annulohypoxylon truncatum]KAI1212495.1 hypothetical protein F4807DRAFT_373725 [Annulohypoxylon truncatum]
MKVTIYDYIVILSCFQVVPLATSVAFSNDICPSWYLRQAGWDDRQDPVLEFVAICSTGNTTSHEYRTSSLNIDPCFTNHNGILEPANTGSSSRPGGFYETCDSCGLVLQGPYGDDKKKWDVYMRCNCKKDGGSAAGIINMESGLSVNDGILNCMNFPGAAMNYSPSANPAMLPLPGTTTLTTTATANSTVASITTATANETFFSTATNTAITTVISSCESPSQVTVTKTHKGKAHKQTVTATMTETHPVTVLVSIMVTPTAKPTIAAQLRSTVVADFSTIN